MSDEAIDYDTPRSIMSANERRPASPTDIERARELADQLEDPNGQGVERDQE